MRYISFASGSSGNCGLITGPGCALLLDAGISLRRIRTALLGQGLDLPQLAGLLITHEHTDHVAALPMLCKHTALPVYCSGGTARALLRAGKCDREHLRLLEPGTVLKLGGLQIRGFETSHDAAQPMGYRMEEGDGGVLSVLTDLGCVNENVQRAAAGSRAAVVEFNHDEEMLRCGSYPYPLKQRILGRMGHLSNRAGASLAGFLAELGAEEFLLAHLSKENNLPSLAMEAARERLGPAAAISVAPPDALSREIIV